MHADDYTQPKSQPCKKSFSLFEKKKWCLLERSCNISSCGAKGTLIVNLTRLLAMVQLGTYIYMSFFSLIRPTELCAFVGDEKIVLFAICTWSVIDTFSHAL